MFYLQGRQGAVLLTQKNRPLSAEVALKNVLSDYNTVGMT